MRASAIGDCMDARHADRAKRPSAENPTRRAFRLCRRGNFDSLTAAIRPRYIPMCVRATLRRSVSPLALHSLHASIFFVFIYSFFFFFFFNCFPYVPTTRMCANPRGYIGTRINTCLGDCHAGIFPGFARFPGVHAKPGPPVVRARVCISKEMTRAPVG